MRTLAFVFVLLASLAHAAPVKTEAQARAIAIERFQKETGGKVAKYSIERLKNGSKDEWIFRFYPAVLKHPFEYWDIAIDKQSGEVHAYEGY